MIESTESKTRDIPVWLTAIVILLCLGGGTWLVRWYMKDQPPQVADIPEDKLGPANGRGFRGALSNGSRDSGFTARPQRDSNANGIQPWGPRSFRAKMGNTAMNINYTGSTGRFDIVPQILNIQTPEEAKLAVMRMNILMDANWREYLKITPEQLSELSKVPPRKSVALDAADKARLSEMWKAYHDGAASVKAEKEKELLAALDEVGKKNLASTKEYENKRAEMVRAALTADQIKLYDDAGGKAPAAKPVVEPVKPAASKLNPATPTTITPTDTKKPAVVKDPEPQVTTITGTPSGATPLIKSGATTRPSATTRPAAVAAPASGASAK